MNRKYPLLFLTILYIFSLVITAFAYGGTSTSGHGYDTPDEESGYRDYSYGYGTPTTTGTPSSSTPSTSTPSAGTPALSSATTYPSSTSTATPSSSSGTYPGSSSSVSGYSASGTMPGSGSGTSVSPSGTSGGGSYLIGSGTSSGDDYFNAQVNSDGSVTISVPKAGGGDLDTTSAISTVFQKYKKVAVAILGICVITAIIFMLIQISKLGMAGSNDMLRRRAITGILVCGIVIAVFGGLTVVVGFFWNAL